MMPMKKDTRLTFRVNSDLKREVESIATREGQSAARICEAFIMAGSDAYKRQGTKSLRRMLGRLGTKNTD
jgi:predicted transcriptional regulator